MRDANGLSSSYGMMRKKKSSRRIAIISPLRMVLLQRYLYPKHLHSMPFPSIYALKLVIIWVSEL
uniref:Uncharacterized protein n=1 Tax=Triticum urartu TaxID=4572 RepID=A0A8R7TNF4_TRIUA